MRTTITLNNSLNSADSNLSGFPIWCGGKVRGDVKNGAVKIEKNNTDVELEITPDVLVDGKLLCWYFYYGWYSMKSITGPFINRQRYTIPRID
jgi:hypothetical protein